MSYTLGGGECRREINGWIGRAVVMSDAGRGSLQAGGWREYM